MMPLLYIFFTLAAASIAGYIKGAFWFFVVFLAVLAVIGVINFLIGRQDRSYDPEATL